MNPPVCLVCKAYILKEGRGMPSRRCSCDSPDAQNHPPLGTSGERTGYSEGRRCFLWGHWSGRPEICRPTRESQRKQYLALGTGFRSEVCGSKNANNPGRGPATYLEFTSMVSLECHDHSEVWAANVRKSPFFRCWGVEGEAASDESLSLSDSVDA